MFFLVRLQSYFLRNNHMQDHLLLLLATGKLQFMHDKSLPITVAPLKPTYYCWLSKIFLMILYFSFNAWPSKKKILSISNTSHLFFKEKEHKNSCYCSFWPGSDLIFQKNVYVKWSFIVKGELQQLPVKNPPIIAC